MNKRKFNKREWTLKKKYGLTLAAWDALFNGQGRCCAVCKTLIVTKRGWFTDHDHKTGKLRGVLCHHCNLLLGNAKDDIAILAAAIEYLSNR